VPLHRFEGSFFRLLPALLFASIAQVAKLAHNAILAAFDEEGARLAAAKPMISGAHTGKLR